MISGEWKGVIFMDPIEKILFPVDFSEVSPMIAPFVLMVGESFKAEIHILFVARTLEYFSSIYVSPVTIQNFEEDVIKGAEKKMDEFVQSHFKNYPSLRTKVSLGDAAEEILKYIHVEGVDLVIIGTHGRKGLERILFGSVAERVIKMSTVPVVSINPYRQGDVKQWEKLQEEGFEEARE
jgi:nucleotide-binding universal stress UspA family protein